jgi:hypothetical protein
MILKGSSGSTIPFAISTARIAPTVISHGFATASALRYEDVLEAGNGNGADPAALLLVAAAHGSAGRQFDRLQHVVDVLQSARRVAGQIEVERLKTVASRCGLLFAVIAALDLAGRMFDVPSCRSLLGELAPRRFDRAASRLLSPNLVIGAQSEHRFLASWRRKIFRQTLRGAARRSAQLPPTRKLRRLRLLRLGTMLPFSSPDAVAAHSNPLSPARACRETCRHEAGQPEPD